MRIALLLPFTAALSLAATQTAATLRVPATSNPYLAGLTAGTSSYGDSAPQQSPVLVELYLGNAAYVSFSATGSAQHHPNRPPKFDSPNGSLAVTHAAEHGISQLTAPIDSLLGVFLTDDRPDRDPAPPAVNFRTVGWNFVSLEPKLKQVFFIGTGHVNARPPGSSRKKLTERRFFVPKGATRLFLAVMDEYEWNNNEGYFDVTVTLEQTAASSNMFSVDSTVSFAKWACLPDRSQCTPDRGIVEATAPGQYHVVLPAHLEWGVSVPNPTGSPVAIRQAAGTVCLDAQSRVTSSCTGPLGSGRRAGAGFLSPDDTAGELIGKITGGRAWFSVNGRSGAFQDHQGYFEFDVAVK